MVAALVAAGCAVNLQLPNGNAGGAGIDTGALGSLETAAGTVQTVDPRDAALPDALAAAGDTIVIDPNVQVIVNVQVDLPAENLPDSTVLGFDNQTGFDLFLQYLANDELQGIYVYDGETLLLDYPCLDRIEMLSEDDIDPISGFVVDSFDLAGVFLNPDDFLCGDALILPFSASTVDVTVELIALVP
jgi:hypothetical protein